MTTPESPIIAGEETVRTWHLPASRADDVRATVEKVNRRARRNGLPTYTLTIEAGEPEPVYDDDLADGTTEIDGKRVPTRHGQPCALLYWQDTIDVTVTGAVPRIADWEAVAVLTRDPEAGVITRTWPGVSADLDLTVLRNRESACDHCGTDRWRKDTYAVRNIETGALKQVGSNCLTLFFGLPVRLSDGWFGRTNLDDELDGMVGGWAAGDQRYEVATVVEYAVAAVTLFGWVSSTDAQYDPGKVRTSWVVGDAISGRTPAARKLREDLLAVMGDDTRQRAQAIIEWARTLDEQQSSEYARNLAAIARSAGVTIRNMALLVSAVSSFARNEQREIERKRAGDSRWQGQVGKRQVFTGLTVSAVHATPGYYGTTYITKFMDDDGNRFTWFASSHPGVDQGDRCDVKGTVKAHSEWNGIQETQLTRCVCTPVQQPVAATA